MFIPKPRSEVWVIKAQVVEGGKKLPRVGEVTSVGQKSCARN